MSDREEEPADFHLVWLTGASCDGCTVALLGDTTVAPLEALLLGRVPGLPRLRLVHPVFCYESGEAFMDLLRRAERGELAPFALVVESSIPRPAPSGGSWSWHGAEQGRLVDVGEWVIRLARRAAAVVAFGDCGVFGGPHSDGSNPTGATGAESHLGLQYRSALGLPVINLPGCAAPPVLIATLATILRWARGEGPPLELDDLGRPAAAYPD